MPRYRPNPTRNPSQHRTLPQRTLDYLAHGAGKGNRNDELFNAAQQFRDAGYSQAESEPRLIGRGMADGLPEFECRKAINSGYSQPARAPAGHPASGNGTQVHNAPHQQRTAPKSVPSASAAANGTAARTLPDPIAGGLSVLLGICFLPGEYVSLSGIVVDAGGMRHPGGGDTFTVEQLQQQLAQRSIDQMYSDPDGLYIRMNPMCAGGKSDKEVTSFRHVLVEFDLDENGSRIPKISQYNALIDSGLPISVIIDSGDKSIHAWVRVDAANLEEFKARREIVWEKFAASDLDVKNKNPSRYSRCPGVPRNLYDDEGNQYGVGHQELLAVNVGPASWAEYERATSKKKTGARFPAGHSIDWFAKQAINDNDTLLGNRYLCRTGGMFIVAPSGLGKSILSIQMAVLWCCGLIAFGITPRRALRILIVQSEDDQGDCTEMSQVMDHLNLNNQQKALVATNSVLVRCNHLVGWEFIEALRAELADARDAGQPFDLVIINPYGVYLGADVKDTNACTEFLNRGLNPVLSEFDVGAILIHHTPKTNFQKTENYNIWDWMYHGAGCASITNWARAMMAIKPETEDLQVYRFVAAKRGKRIDDWNGAFERYFAWSSIPGVLRWEDATAAQINQATAAAGRRKTVDLLIACQQVPPIDPELKTIVIRKIQTACKVGVHRAKDALNELIVTGKVDCGCRGTQERLQS
jgi:RecA-family ATPase